MPVGALIAIARAEWRRGGRALVLLGVAAGLVGGLLVAGVALVRRTATAPDRLLAAVQPGDVHLQVFGPGVVEAVADLPQVADSLTGQIAVGRLEGDAVVYNGVLVPLDPGAGVLHPVVVDGRAADPSVAGEVVVVQEAADVFGLTPGTRFTLTLLTAEEVSRFDVGFGDPDGPRLDLLVTGVVRVPPGVLSNTPIVATPALAGEIEEAVAGTDMYLRLAPGVAAGELDEALAAIAASVEMPPGAEEFPPVVADDPAGGTVDVERSSGVLVVGMLAALGVGLLAGLIVLWQALARHFAGSTAAQRVEAALGLTALERAVARVAPALVTAVVAVVVATGVAIAAGVMEPPGAVARVEPSPGWRLDPTAVVLGVGALVVIVLGLAAGTALRAGRPSAAVGPGARTGAWSLAPRRRGWPLAGVAFALSSGDRRGRVPVRASLAGAVLGVAGVVAAMTFGASLDRLTSTPERYGWTADLVVVDATDEIVADLLADERIGGVSDLGSATVVVDDRSVQAYAAGEGEEEGVWELLDGRMPAAPHEVVLGTRLADDLGVGVGDQVDGGRGDAVDLLVVGVGLGPTLGGETLGQALLLHPEAMGQLSDVQLFREALVTAAPGADVGVLAADLGARYEISVQELPRVVRDLADLGSLPELLGAFIAVLAVAALSHALVVTTRRRARDLAVLHALGSTPREVGLSIVAMALATAGVGVVVGAPLGWLIARLAWGEVARGAGVATDVLVPAHVVTAVLVAVVVAVLSALLPARRAARRSPAEALRAE